MYPPSRMEPGVAEYLADDALQAGLAAGELVQGTLRLYRSGRAGVVQGCLPETLQREIYGDETLDGDGGGGGGGGGGARLADLAVLGQRSINRALDGDEVVARMLPRAKWGRARVRQRAFDPPDQAAAAAAADADTADGARAAAAAAAGGGGGVDDASGGGGGFGLAAQWMRSTFEAIAGGGGGGGGAPGVDVDDEAVAEAEAAELGRLLPHGEVVGLVKRGARAHVATLYVPEKPGDVRADFAFVAYPRDRRVPGLLLPELTRERALELKEQLLMVRAGEWDAGARFPRGELVRSLGAVGEISAENEAILLTHQIDTSPWSAAVNACLPDADWAVDTHMSAADLAGRLDLRRNNGGGQAAAAATTAAAATATEGAEEEEEAAARPLIVSIDPPGCVDIDDAMHARRIAPGRWEVGVHIADVGHFVRAGSALEAEAAARGTATYVVERRVDMIPAVLSTQVCSLHADVDRLAVSVLWEMDDDANVLKTSFARAVIRSEASLSYDEAQTILKESWRDDELATSLRSLDSLAQKLRGKRRAAGAFMLNGADATVARDPTATDGATLALELKRALPVNELVEELMVLANRSVAAQLLTRYPQHTLLRHHMAPLEETLAGVQRSLAARGMELDASSAEDLGRSLDALQPPDDEPQLIDAVRYLVTRSLPPAKYLASAAVEPVDFRHCGLALDVYTHFTSPIRRYADVVVHRMLGASLGWCAEQPADVHLGTLNSVADKLNERREAARQAERDSLRLYTLLYLRQTIEQNGVPEVEAYVVGLADNGVRLHVPSYDLEDFAFVHERAAPNRFTLDDTGEALRAERFGVELRVLDRVVVRISADGSATRLKLKLEIVEPRLPDATIAPRQAAVEGAAAAAG